MKLKTDNHVLVCDGGKYLLLQNTGDEDIMNLTVVAHREATHKAVAEIGRERPGTFYGRDTHRGSGEGSDPHEQAKAEFVQGVVNDLENLWKLDIIHHILILADQRSLGYLRDHMSDGLRSTVIAEIAADHVHQTVEDIETSVERASL